jgi:hypothetical protein
VNPTADPNGVSRRFERVAYFLIGVLVGRIGLAVLLDRDRTQHCAAAAHAVVDNEESMPDTTVRHAYRCLDSIEPLDD